MNKLNNAMLTLLLVVVLGCTDKNDNFVFFSIEQDVELGAQVAAEIANDPDQFPVLDEVQYAEAYDYLGNMVDEILESGEVEYREEFAWEFKIIANDTVLNAFATPGGYIYVYTGLIKYLDQEDDLVGVLGHEIAHADLRHTSRNLQNQYGLQVLVGLLTGEDPSQLEAIASQIAGTAAGLSFSRKFETEADARSVDYLANTKYACNGAASFFQKLIDQGQTGSTPQFLSTHPSPENRVEDINAKAAELGCDITPENPNSYEDFKQLLP